MILHNDFYYQVLLLNRSKQMKEFLIYGSFEKCQEAAKMAQMCGKWLRTYTIAIDKQRALTMATGYHMQLMPVNDFIKEIGEN